MSMAGTATTTLFTSLTQQSYLVKMDLDSSIVFCENPVFMSVQIVVIPLDVTTTWMDIKTGFSQKKYGAIQVCFRKVVSLCDHSYFVPMFSKPYHNTGL